MQLEFAIFRSPGHIMGEAVSMSSMIVWMIALTVSVCVTILAAAMKMPLVHMATSGMISLLFALLAVWDHNKLVSEGASKSLIGASTARHAGLIWAWGAVGLLFTYFLVLENSYSEAWQFCLGFLAAAAASLILASMLDRDAAALKVDRSMMKTGRILVTIQLIAMIGGIISMLYEGKFPRDTSHPDWAAYNIFFFGSLAIAALSLNALSNSPKD